MTSVRSTLNNAILNNIDVSARLALLGEALGAVERFATVTVVAATGIGVLPADARANYYKGIGNVYVTAGTVNGIMTFKGVNTTPTTGTYTITPDGNLLFLTTDAVTSVEIFYAPMQGDVVTETLPVVSNAATLSGSRVGILLYSVTNQAGTAKTVDTSRGTGPANGHAALSLLGTTVALNASDTSTSVTVTYLAMPSVGVATPSLYDRLAADEPF